MEFRKEIKRVIIISFGIALFSVIIKYGLPIIMK